jgi:serine protease Do
MKPEQYDYETLDRFHKGLLSGQEVEVLRERMESDPEFKKEADEYLELIGAVKFYGDRQVLKSKLSEIQEEVDSEKLTLKPGVVVSPFRKYWRMTAVAASVMIASVIGTLIVTQTRDREHNAAYKELRRNVEQIKKSQRQIMNDLAESKGNTVAPGKYTGTGFLISSLGYVATSYHVIRESDSVLLENEFFGPLKASVIYSDALNDISILKVENVDFKMKGSLPFIISPKEADLGEYVYTLGFPREDVVFGEGSVSASTGYGQNPNSYQVSVPVNPGNSGGPLLNERGELVGMVSGVQTETQGAAFAIKSTQILEVVNSEAMDSLATNLVLPKLNSLRSSNRVQQVKKLRNFVFMIRVYNNK